MTKLIAFEGISGSGKSYLINSICSRCQETKVIKWFDNDRVSNLLGRVHNFTSVSHDFYTVCYAMDFFGEYKYKIEVELKTSNVILHRYIYTPLTHDVVRGSSITLLKEIYDSSNIVEPDLVVYMDTPPELAYNRIIKTRKPSFYECGLDVFRWDDLEQAKQDYTEERISKNDLKEYYMTFQSRVVSEYNELFKGKKNVFRVKPGMDIGECTDYIVSLLK